MICPKCEKEYFLSKVIVPSSGLTTAMCDHDFYDENGKFHHHDMNGMSRTFHCTEGHTGTIVTYQECWCGYNKGMSHIRVDE